MGLEECSITAPPTADDDDASSAEGVTAVHAAKEAEASSTAYRFMNVLQGGRSAGVSVDFHSVYGRGGSVHHGLNGRGGLIHHGGGGGHIRIDVDIGHGTRGTLARDEGDGKRQSCEQRNLLHRKWGK
jgi:hypothetical protein